MDKREKISQPIEGPALSSEYLRIKRNYASSNQKQFSFRDKAEPEEDEWSYEEKSKLMQPAIPQLNEFASSQITLEEKFVRLIKVASLRPMREKEIIKSFVDTIAWYKESLKISSDAVEEWIAYAKKSDEKNFETIRMLELETNERVHIENAMEELESSFVELQRDLKASDHAKQAIVEQNELKMNDFLDQVESRVEEVKTEMAQEISRIKSESEAELSMMKDEKQKCMNDLLTQEKENNSAMEHLQEELKEKESCIVRIKQENIKKQLQLQEKNGDLEKNIEKNKVEMKLIKEEFDAFKEQREYELTEIEKRVQILISKKDIELQSSLLRAKEAEKRAKAFEQCTPRKWIR